MLPPAASSPSTASSPSSSKMAAQREKGRTLQLLVLFGLLSLSTQFEVTEDEWKELRPDMTGLYRLRGPPEHMLWNASESRLACEYGNFLDGFQECGTFLAGVKENLGLLLTKTEKLNPVPQEEVDPSSQYDHQQIIMLQDDVVVRKAATFLYEKHPAVSSVYVLDDQQKVKLIAGKSTPLSENSRLVLVGHGARDHSGEMRVSGFSYKDVSSIIQSTSRVTNKVKTTSLVSCEVGSDQQFIENLMKDLHGAGIETELHLWNAVIQVTQTGHIISQDVSPDGQQWRLNDDSKKVVAALQRNGEMIRRHESGSRGEPVFTKERNFLKPPKKPGNKGNSQVDTSKLYRTSWPQEPMSFIHSEVYKKIDQNKVELIKNDFKEIESLTWGMFHLNPNSDQPEKVNTNNQPNIQNECIILQTGTNWLDNQQKLEVLRRCYVINSGAQTRDLIRHYAKDGEEASTYVMVNDWIFLVEPKNLYVYPVGKRLDEDERGNEKEKEIQELIVNQNRENSENYNNIRNGIEQKNSYPYYVRGILTGNNVHKPAKEEMFLTWYFTASVIAESARNFRTFPLTLMVLDMDEQHYTEGAWNLLFDGHPMARGGSWINENLRGFSGSAAPPDSQFDKLLEVLKKELEIFRKWKTSHGADVQPEVQMETLITNYHIHVDNLHFTEGYRECKDAMNTNTASGSSGASGSLGGYKERIPEFLSAGIMLGGRWSHFQRSSERSLQTPPSFLNPEDLYCFIPAGSCFPQQPE